MDKKKSSCDKEKCGSESEGKKKKGKCSFVCIPGEFTTNNFQYIESLSRCG